MGGSYSLRDYTTKIKVQEEFGTQVENIYIVYTSPSCKVILLTSGERRAGILSV